MNPYSIRLSFFSKVFKLGIISISLLFFIVFFGIYFYQCKKNKIQLSAKQFGEIVHNSLAQTFKFVSFIILFLFIYKYLISNILSI
jgi:hypothetical protein